ncbi:EcsC family protein [Metabacillus sp. RGM 3146]|uniref:EcsC family protein n=1 Tax=Metabacillus sp. RGM 3146 TaxID=3401092 RepID=UPI003B996B21
MLNSREKRLLNEIHLWEKHLRKDMRPELQRTYDEWVKEILARLPEERKNIFFSKVDDLLFHFYSLIQNSSLLHDSGKKIINIAQNFDNSIQSINDCKRLSADQQHFIANTQLAKHRLYSFLQGGLTGAGGLLLFGVDLPALSIIQMKAVQVAAMSYGYETNSPYEMMNSLKVYHAAILPKHLRWKAWVGLMDELDSMPDFPFLYEGDEQLADESLIHQAASQIGKFFIVSAARRKVFQGIPLIGIAACAGANYRFTKQVTDFAQNYYACRRLKEREGE